MKTTLFAKDHFAFGQFQDSCHCKRWWGTDGQPKYQPSFTTWNEKWESRKSSKLLLDKHVEW